MPITLFPFYAVLPVILGVQGVGSAGNILTDLPFLRPTLYPSVHTLIALDVSGWWLRF